MKKRYLILAGILAASMLAAGCGKKNSVAPEQKVEATVTPTVTEAAKTDVVEMQTSTDDTANIKNVMGTKSETTTSIVFTNKMGSAISAIYVRPTRDDGDDSDETWGSDLVNGKFTLADKDKAVYYMEKSQKDDDGNAVTSFDVRVTFSDEDQNDCFFRQLPLQGAEAVDLAVADHIVPVQLKGLHPRLRQAHDGQTAKAQQTELGLGHALVVGAAAGGTQQIFGESFLGQIMPGITHDAAHCLFLLFGLRLTPSEW